MNFLTAIPIYNEERHLEAVLNEVRRYSEHILVVNDGSTDRTAELLAQQPGIRVVTHPQNRGYGAALISAFDYALPARIRRAGDDGLRRPARAGPHPGAARSDPRRRHRLAAAAICATSARTRCARRTAAHQSDITHELNSALRPEPDRCVLRLQGVSAGGARTACISPKPAGACRCKCGCRRPGAGCASRKSACRGCISIPTGRSAAC